uniref:Uncharacterized protein n=1 Tax=Salmonella sp. 96A-29192 TaxID=1179814 RepID=I3VZS2_9ENTR|nr:hypothetical protein [Salmonella sp. 96A-29192]
MYAYISFNKRQKRESECGVVKRRGVVSPPLATFPHSSIDKPADQFQDSDYSVRHCNNRPQNDD